MSNGYKYPPAEKAVIMPYETVGQSETFWVKVKGFNKYSCQRCGNTLALGDLSGTIICERCGKINVFYEKANKDLSGESGE